MTIDEAIHALQRMKSKHGGAIEVFFDCPSCLQAFTPGIIEAQAIHLKGGKPDAR